MPGLTKFDDFSYEIVIKGIPYEQNITLFRGDEISITIRGINGDDAQSPFNYSLADILKVDITIAGEKVLASITEGDNVLLGQSDKAIQYDIDNNNPPGFTQDEFHFIDPDFALFGDSKYPTVEIVPKIIFNTSVYSLILFRASIKNNRTL